MIWTAVAISAGFQDSRERDTKLLGDTLRCDAIDKHNSNISTSGSAERWWFLRPSKIK